MRRRLQVLALAIAALVSVALSAAGQAEKYSASAAPGFYGRFQLFQGRHTVNSAGQPFEETAVFRIDTQTGKTWVYREGRTKEEKFYSRWEPVSE